MTHPRSSFTLTLSHHTGTLNELLILAAHLDREEWGFKTVMQHNTDKWSLGILSFALCTEADLSAEIAAFRAHIFPNVYESGQFATVEDLIDFHSLHIVLRINSKVSAYSRITSAEFLVFSYFTESLAELPSAADTWSLGRGGVAVEWRRAELLTVVVIEGIRQCRLRGATHVVGAVPPTEKALTTIQRSLMQPAGPVVLSGHPGQRVSHQPVVHTRAEYRDGEILQRRDMAVERSLGLLSLCRSDTMNVFHGDSAATRAQLP
jgi:hypothetical protein